MIGTSRASVRSLQRLQTWLLVALGGITLAVFAGVCGHEFVHYDDAANIYANPHLKGLGWDALQWMFTDVSYARRYMPLGWLSYAVDYQLFGLNPKAYHVGNLLLHSGNVLLLFFLLKRLLIRARPSQNPDEADPAPIWCAAIGALFWAVNPLRVESVAWASSRIYGVVCLSTLLWLLSWLRAQDPATPKSRRRVFYWCSVAAYGASLLTYPLALFAPVALVVLDVVLLRRMSPRPAHWWRPEARAVWRSILPFLVLAGGVLVLTFAARMLTDSSHQPLTLGEFGLLSRVMQAFYIWTYYAWKPWFPYDLAASYTTLHSFNPLAVKFLLSACFVCLVTLVLFWRRRQWPAALGLWICHLVLLVPVLGLTEYPHSAYDRYSYVQGILWSVALALVLLALWDRGSRGYLASVTVAVTSLMFGLLAWQQVPIWRDTITLYRHLVTSIGQHPNRSRFDEVLGVHYLLAGLTNEAVASLQSASDYEQRRTDRHLYDEGVLRRANLRLGDVFVDQGRLEAALTCYQAALSADQASVIAVVKMGSTLAKLNRDGEAVTCLREAVRMKPDSASAHHALATVLAKLGRAEEAQLHWEEERRLLAGK